MPKVIIYIQAFSAEKTLARAVDSILSQTYQDWVCYLCDNGSTDGTRSIIEDYARQNLRVKPLLYEQNDGQLFLKKTLPLIIEKSNADYFVQLDSDDEYKPNFLRESISFMTQNDCDVVCCGNDFIDSQSERIVGKRQLANDLIIDSKESYSGHLPAYYQFIRTLWGKIIKVSILSKINRQEIIAIYGMDTYICSKVIENANKIGILAATHYRYYMSVKSTSYRLEPERIDSDRVLYDRACDFLTAKCGTVSPRNNEFLLCVYVNALKDTLKVLLNANTTQTENLNGLRDMFLCDHARKLAAYERFGALLDNEAAYTAQRKELFKAVSDWLLSLKEVPDDEVEGYCELGEFVSAAADDGGAWVMFKKLLAQYLLDQGRVEEALLKLDELAEILPEDEEIEELAKKHKKAPTPKRNVANENISPSAATEKPYRNGCDDEFYALIERLKSESLDQLLTTAANSANEWLKEDYEYYGLLLKWYKDWYRVGAFAQDQGFINYFGMMYQYLKQNVNELATLYESLGDYRSKLTLKIMLQHWLTFHPDLRKNGTESFFEHYFDLDLFKCDENEVFVDCGCEFGDTVQAYVKHYSRYKSIYSYELTPSTYEKAKQNLAGIPRVYLRNVGVSKENGEFPFVDNIGGGNRLTPTGNVIAKVVKIDDDITEDVTFIKMDVEAAEIDALNGAEQQIRRNKPKLAISLYHKLSDLLDIPRLVKSFVPEYTLYLRNSHSPNFPFPTEYVLLAVVEQNRTKRG